MARFLSDTFTDTDGVHLEDHVGEVGAIWTRHPDYSGPPMHIVNNRVEPNGDYVLKYYGSGIPAGTDYTVTGNLFYKADYTWSEIGVVGRCSTSVDTMYCMYYYQYTDEWAIEREVLGTWVNITTWGEALGANDTREFKLSMVGTGPTILRGYVDGTERLYYSDSTDITGTGRAGVDSYKFDGVVLSDIVADDIEVSALSILLSENINF